MIKQTLFFSTPVYLSLKNCQIVISWKDSDDKITRPIEDIGCVVLENQMISITLPLLNELVKNNVAVILCDNKMMPTSMLQSLDANQSAVLGLAGKNKDILKPYYDNVKSGDSDNREGLAAKVYWNSLFGNSFKRERDGCPPNALLNYGYAILRAAVARALLGSGLLPNLGIFHKSRYNAFPLADDVMEPYRPFVDEIVYRLYGNGITELNKESKSEIMRVLNSDVNIGKVKRPLQIALTITTASLVKYYSGKIKKLSLPIMT